MNENPLRTHDEAQCSEPSIQAGHAGWVHPFPNIPCTLSRHTLTFSQTDMVLPPP